MKCLGILCSLAMTVHAFFQFFSVLFTDFFKLNLKIMNIYKKMSVCNILERTYVIDFLLLKKIGIFIIEIKRVI